MSQRGLEGSKSRKEVDELGDDPEEKLVVHND